MNQNLQNVLLKIGQVFGSALLIAFGGLLSKILEPTLKWIMFISMKLLIKVLPKGKFRDTVLSYYKELRAVYKEKNDVS